MKAKKKAAPRKRAVKAPPVKAAETVLILRTCSADMTSRDGFKWPESGPIEAPDWSTVAQCGQGRVNDKGQFVEVSE